VCDPCDQLVADPVAERVVDRLEVVEVEHDRRAARPVALDVGDVALELALERAPVEQSGERVVVGQVAQLRLVAAALGHVLHLAEEVQRLAVRAAHERARQRRPHRLAVGVQVALLGAVGLGLAGDHRGHRVPVGVAVVRVGERRDVAPLQRPARVPEQARERAVDALEVPVGRGDGHADRRLLEGRAEARLRLLDRGLRGHALGDVAHGRVGLHRAAGGVAQDTDPGLDPHPFTVGAPKPDGHRGDVDPGGDLGQRGDEVRQVVRVHELLRTAPDQRARIDAEQFAARGGEVLDPAVGGVHDEHVRRGLRQPARALLGREAAGLGDPLAPRAQPAREPEDEGEQQRDDRDREGPSGGRTWALHHDRPHAPPDRHLLGDRRTPAPEPAAEAKAPVAQREPCVRHAGLHGGEYRLDGQDRGHPAELPHGRREQGAGAHRTRQLERQRAARLVDLLGLQERGPDPRGRADAVGALGVEAQVGAGGADHGEAHGGRRCHDRRLQAGGDLVDRGPELAVERLAPRAGDPLDIAHAGDRRLVDDPSRHGVERAELPVVPGGAHRERQVVEPRDRLAGDRLELRGRQPELEALDVVGGALRVLPARDGRDGAGDEPDRHHERGQGEGPPAGAERAGTHRGATGVHARLIG